MTRLKRYTWEDAIVEAEATGHLKAGAANFALRISRVINWSPKDNKQPGLYWANELATEVAGMVPRSYYNNAPRLIKAGFLTKEGNNHIPSLPANFEEIHAEYVERQQSLIDRYNAQKQAKIDRRESKTREKATAKVAVQTENNAVPTANLAVPTAKVAVPTANNAVPTAKVAGYLVKTYTSVDPLTEDGFKEQALADAPAESTKDEEEGTSTISSVEEFAACGGSSQDLPYPSKDEEPSLSQESSDVPGIEVSERGSATANFAVGTDSEPLVETVEDEEIERYWETDPDGLTLRQRAEREAQRAVVGSGIKWDVDEIEEDDWF